MKVAIVHDWLVTYAGAERVLEQMLIAFPDADVFALVDFIPKKDRGWLLNKAVHTSFVQKMPFAKSKYRFYMPLMMYAVEQFDLSGYDIVISSSHAVSKGVLTGPNQLHICMCYSPIRYAWDLQHQYLIESNMQKGIKSFFVRWLLHKIRIWDTRTSNGVDHFIAISNFIAKRIGKTYRRDSAVIYPSVDTSIFARQKVEKKEFYVTCSRMVPYKKIDLIVDTFATKFPDKHLVVIGDGPDFKKIKDLGGENIKFTGRLGFNELHNYLLSAKAFIFAAEEDFGIAPLEAQSCGTPVIAFARGGALETIVGLNSENPTGVFFDDQTVESLSAAIVSFEENAEFILPQNCRDNALRFSNSRFQKEFVDFVTLKFKVFKENV